MRLHLCVSPHLIQADLQSKQICGSPNKPCTPSLHSSQAGNEEKAKRGFREARWYGLFGVYLGNNRRRGRVSRPTVLYMPFTWPQRLRASDMYIHSQPVTVRNSQHGNSSGLWGVRSFASFQVICYCRSVMQGEQKHISLPRTPLVELLSD